MEKAPEGWTVAAGLRARTVPESEQANATMREVADSAPTAAAAFTSPQPV